MELEIVTLESKAFEQLITELADFIRTQIDEPTDIWITAEEAMQQLHIKSKTTLGELRKKGLIRYARVTDRIILFDRTSIADYLNQKANTVRHGNI